MLRLGDMWTLLGERQCLSAAHTGALVAERERRRAPASPAGRLTLAGTCSAATIGREAPTTPAASDTRAEDELEYHQSVEWKA